MQIIYQKCDVVGVAFPPRRLFGTNTKFAGIGQQMRDMTLIFASRAP